MIILCHCFEPESLKDPDLASVTSLARCSTRMDAFPFCHICLQCAQVLAHVYVQMCVCAHVCLGEDRGISPRLTSAVCIDCCLSCFRKALSVELRAHRYGWPARSGRILAVVFRALKLIKRNWKKKQNNNKTTTWLLCGFWGSELLSHPMLLMQMF